MKTQTEKRKCVFFDRDGVVNIAPPPEEYYVRSLDRFFIMPEFMESLRVVNQRDYAAVIVTNQRCIERGLITWDEINRIHEHLRSAVSAEGLELLDIMVCPHGDHECDCRKPLPGMLLDAARRYNLDLPGSWMVGDHESDVLAGFAAGCRTVRIAPSGTESVADFRIDGMKYLPEFLAGHLT